MAAELVHHLKERCILIFEVFKDYLDFAFGLYVDLQIMFRTGL